MPKADFMLVLHTAPMPVGMVANVAGTRLAGTDQIDVMFHGVGGHGSTPQFAKDPVLMAAMAVVQYQAIVSRIIDLQQMAVLTVGSIRAGTDNNVIPDSALIMFILPARKRRPRRETCRRSSTTILITESNSKRSGSTPRLVPLPRWSCWPNSVSF